MRETDQPKRSAPAARLGRPTRRRRSRRFCWTQIRGKPTPWNRTKNTSMKKPIPRAAIGLYSSAIFASSVVISNMRLPLPSNYGLRLCRRRCTKSPLATMSIMYSLLIALEALADFDVGVLLKTAFIFDDGPEIRREDPALG